MRGSVHQTHQTQPTPTHHSSTGWPSGRGCGLLETQTELEYAKMGTCFLHPKPMLYHSVAPTPPCPSPSHQIQRPEQEVHQLSCTGVLDVLLQLRLGAGRTSR